MKAALKTESDALPPPPPLLLPLPLLLFHFLLHHCHPLLLLPRAVKEERHFHSLGRTGRKSNPDRGRWVVGGTMCMYVDCVQ